MAEQRNQTPAGDNTQWTTIIRPRTGWFDVDLEELWRYRDLIVMFVKRNFTVMYKQTILGPLWIILNPLITTVLFNVVFGGIAGLSTDGTPSFLFYMAGNTVWTFFASCINGTANTFVANSQVFGKVYFPRLTTPISQVLTSLINFFIQFVMYILFWVYFAVTGSGVHLTAWAFAVPLVVLEVMLLGLGVGIIVSALTTKYRDLAIAVSFGVQLWMYISPVVYPLSSLEESPRLQMLMRLNPMTAPIEVFRMGTLGTGTVEAGSLIYSLYMMGNTMPLADQVYILQSNVIKELAAEGPCVILGRCGDYVLRERKDVLRVFIYAPVEWRRELAKTDPLVKAKDEKGIKEEIEKTDRNRAAYYNYYTQNRWGDAHNYDLAINAALGRETCVKMILDAVAAKEKTMAE